MVVMQNMVPIHGRPSWSSQFLIGTVNACGRFSPLRYVLDNDETPTSCYCEAKDLASGEILRGEKITIAMAKAEGWFDRNGSKWKTMPGQMLRFRAASWWQRVHCPELSLGLPTQEEAIDVEAVTVSEVPAAAIAPAVPEPLTHSAAEHAEAIAPAAEPTQAPDSQPVDLKPEPAPATPSDPDPAEPGTIERLPQGRTVIAADPQPELVPAPAAARRTAPSPVRRSATASSPAADAPIPGLD